jgi:hypothetical protein
VPGRGSDHVARPNFHDDYCRVFRQGDEPRYGHLARSLVHSGYISYFDDGVGRS